MRPYVHRSIHPSVRTKFILSISAILTGYTALIIALVLYVIPLNTLTSPNPNLILTLTVTYFGLGLLRYYFFAIITSTSAIMLPTKL